MSVCAGWAVAALAFGLLVGAALGLFTASLCFAAKMADDHAEGFTAERRRG